MTYACPACEFTADNYLLKLQHLQNKVLCNTGNFSRHTLIHKLYVASNIPYMCNLNMKLCRQQADIVSKHKNVYVHNKETGEATHRKHKRL
jgi:hypothetical protein